MPNLDKSLWPPNFDIEYERRELINRILVSSGDPRELARGLYKDDPSQFIEDWCITYDPRNISKKLPTKMPFVPFTKQRELIDFLMGCLNDQESGLVEKCRDMGVTWMCCGLSVWLWCYFPGAAVGWGSRKEALVDRLGDPSSIFQKIRMIIDNLPVFILPEDFSYKDHCSFMRITGPHGATITGEAGDNIGRGGRTTLYFKDEAQPLNANILTPTGWKSMSEMAVGTKVVGVDGQSHAVTQIKDYDEHDIYKIGFSDGTFAECSPNHLWTVDKVWGKKKRLTVRTKDIVDDFVYHSPGGQSQYKYRLPTCLPVELTNQGQLPLDPYIVGALLGDGGVSGVPEYGAKITTKDVEIIHEFTRLLPDGCKIGSEHNYSYNLVDVAGRQGRKKGKMRQAIVDAGIAGCCSYEKFIPDMYKFASVEDRISLLQGLMDTDGSASGGVASYHTSSGKLSDDVQFIIRSLGGVVTHNVKPDHRGYRDMHVLHMALSSEFVPYRLSRKINALRKRKHPLSRSIVSVERSGKQKVRCISVDVDDGLYLTNDFIVTHNSAHYERPESIEASLGDNTDCQIDISSVNGPNNIFHRKRHSGAVRVFIMDWSDHPGKTQKWYDKRKEKAESQGLMHIFSQEVDRDYNSSNDGVLIPGMWVRAAIDAHVKLGIKVSGKKRAAFDVADEGGDVNAVGMVHGVVLVALDTWGVGDTGESTARAFQFCEQHHATEMVYDSVGVGAGAKAAARTIKSPVKVVPYNGVGVMDSKKDYVEGKKNEDMFSSGSAQDWWLLRDSFLATYNAVVKGEDITHDKLISLRSDLPHLQQLVSELSQVTRTVDGAGRIKIVKTPPGTKSPNLADVLKMARSKVSAAKGPNIRVL